MLSVAELQERYCELLKENEALEKENFNLKEGLCLANRHIDELEDYIRDMQTAFYRG